MFKIFVLGIVLSTLLSAGPFDSEMGIKAGDDLPVKRAKFLSHLKSKLSKMNMAYPKRIDELTLLDSISIEGETVVYKHTVTDPLMNKLTQEQIQLFKRGQESGFKKHYCGNGFTVMRDLNVKVVQEYYSSKKKFLAKVSADFNDCLPDQ